MERLPKRRCGSTDPAIDRPKDRFGGVGLMTVLRAGVSSFGIRSLARGVFDTFKEAVVCEQDAGVG